MNIIKTIEGDLQLFVDRAKAAWDRGEREMHDFWHKKAQAAAPAGATVEHSGNEDGHLVVVAPTIKDADKPAADAKPE